MLTADELRRARAVFGASADQVRRDHVLSHVIATLGSSTRPWVLFGGTGLARTHLPEFRLSEDLDLLVPDRVSAARELEDAVVRRLRREVGDVSWTVRPSAVRQPAAGLLATADGLLVRIQVLEHDADWQRWPTELRQLDVRYADAAPTALRVPTLSSFVGMKTAAWEDRHAARDLADLDALVDLDGIDPAAAEVFRRATGRPVGRWTFAALPDRTLATWRAQLAHQMRTVPDPMSALSRVREAWLEAVGRD